MLWTKKRKDYRTFQTVERAGKKKVMGKPHMYSTHAEQ